MSKLQELIEEFCPNGVEYKTLQKICVRQKGTSITAGEMKKLDKPNAPIRIFAAGNTVANVDYDDIPEKDIITKTSIIVKSRGNIGFEYYTKPFSHKNEMWSYSANDSNINLKFIYYYLMNHIREFQLKAKTGKLPQISTPDTDNFIIPIPPLPVQSEIVRILDNFTELTAELTAKLTAELTARKKQYEYYRDKLMKFSAEFFITLGDIADVTKLAGYEFTAHVLYSDEGNIIALRGLNIKEGKLVLNDVKYIDKSNLKKIERSKLWINDMLFTYVGTIGQVALIDENDKYYLAPNVARIRFDTEKILPLFMRYYFQTKEFIDTQINKWMQTSSMKNLTMEKIRKFKIPVPSLDEQQRIVAILDRFDTLCNDISTGLPAEIAARQKQYEYYRDKLLTFKELS